MIWNPFRKPGQSSRKEGCRSPNEINDDYQLTPEILAEANAGNAAAQVRIATAFHEGLGVNRNPARAIRYFFAAATHEHGGAQAMIAAAFDTGTVLPHDRVEAMYWALLSKDNGNDLGDALARSLYNQMDDQEREQALGMYSRVRSRTEIDAISDLITSAIAASTK